MKTAASIIAFRDEANKAKRLTQKEKIKMYFNMFETKSTIREVSKVINLPYNSTQKRMSELHKEGFLIITETKIEKSNPNSVYAINKIPEILKQVKLSKFELLKKSVSKCVDSETFEAIMDEFKRMVKLNK